MNINYKEYQDSQLPALSLLKKIGWQYISPDEAFKARGEMFSNVLLDDILEERLHAINSFEYKRESYKFSRGSIQGAINALKNVPYEGLVQTNERVYDLLTLGKSFNETVQGDRKAYTINYIDWKKPGNNVFHVTDEFEIEGLKGKRRPDLVLFVNGIPFVVIENKRRDKNESLEEGISQNIRNQKPKTGIPKLFYYAQLLLAVQPNEVKYAVTGTPAKFWSVWKENVEKEVSKLLSKTTNSTLPENRLATEQDKSIYALCNPNRLLDIVYKYIVYDGPHKKVCRYQQYFAVQETLTRIKQKDKEGNRKGGVIWHTTGSGKSLTMVMLSKALALEPSIESPRVIVVTDRINLDKQIFKTFVNCGKSVKKAKSGNDLVEILQDRSNEIITTIIDKFKVATKKSFKDTSQNIFVLVDESHRSQYGLAHANMKRIVPNAAYIGFTGTPLMKSEKSTSKKFGGFIHKYTIDQAVKDGAVLPLLYEGRSAKLTINKAQIDKGFERLSAPLSEEAQKDLKRKFSSISKIYEADHVIEEIAYDISKHFVQNWQGTGFKAQLAVPKIDTAIKYQKYFESQTDASLNINTKVVFTPKDDRKDNEDVWSESSSEAVAYWNQLLEKYRDQETYENWVIEKFNDDSKEVEIIIVVSKLLTGFDAPRNTVLYLAKPLKAHNLLQAIARVNRLFNGKEHGHIIDYIGVLGKLDEALTEYSALEDFDEEDLTNAVTDIGEVIAKVPVTHANVWDVFKGVYNKNDIETLERHISAKDIRDEFYDRVSIFARTLQTALASDELYITFSDAEIVFYKSELKKFQSLRISVQLRYAEAISYKEYEPRVKKLLDSYIDVESVELLTTDLNIFEKDKVEEALETYGKTPASKADFIAHQMKKVISEKMEEDEAFYKKFSELIEKTISEFQAGRIQESEYLQSILNIKNNLVNGVQKGIPTILQSDPKARAFYGAVNEVLSKNHDTETLERLNDQLANMGLSISRLVEGSIIRDWKRNLDVQRKMENDIEDYLIENRKKLGLEITFDEIDGILLKCLKVAKHNY